MGFLGSDAESRNTRDGVPLTVLSLATKRSWKDSKGEWQSQTEWHRVTCFGQLAEFASSLKKGAHLSPADHKCAYLLQQFMGRKYVGACAYGRVTPNTEDNSLSWRASADGELLPLRVADRGARERSGREIGER
jgi:hypothetical protein